MGVMEAEMGEHKRREKEIKELKKLNRNGCQFTDEELKSFIDESCDIQENWYKRYNVRYVRNGTRFDVHKDDCSFEQFNLCTYLSIQELIDRHHLKISFDKFFTILADYVKRTTPKEYLDYYVKHGRCPM